MTYLSLLRNNLLKLRDEFARTTGLTPSAVSEIVAKDRAFFSRVVRKDFRVGTYDYIAGRFSAVWPMSVDWPADIVRPKPLEIEQKTIDELRREVEKIHSRSVPSEWPAGETWPDDIPLPASNFDIPALQQQEAVSG